MEEKAIVIEPENIPQKTEPVTYLDLLQMAIKQDAGLEKIEKFMDLQERHERNEARKAYVAAMAAFKQNPPDIFKDSQVSYKKKDGSLTEYTHASLGNVTNTISAGLGKHNLSAAWKTDQADNQIKITCTVTHAAGHSESTTLFAPPDSSGGKNTIQSIASTVSYLERYTLLAITGLATVDMDNDGQKEPEFITSEQVDKLKKMSVECDADTTMFLEYLKVEKFTEIPANKYNVAVKALEAKKAGVKK